LWEDEIRLPSIFHIEPKGTNTLTIEEKGNNIHINYLLDKNADKANEYSVYRIQMVSNVLPFYKKYCTEAIILPFPNEDIYKVVVQNSRKEMPYENISDIFDIHINQIWSNSILDNYRASSVYEWQKQHIQLREAGVEFSKRCIRYFEALIEENQSRSKSSTEPLINQTNLLSGLLKRSPKLPRSSKKYFEKELLNDEQKNINEWSFSLNNFLNQYASVIFPKSDNDRRVATINLKSTVYKLIKMQDAYEKIITPTYQYFNTEEINTEEQKLYKRLLKTVSFYIGKTIKSRSENIPFARSAVEQWWELQKKQRLDLIHSIVKEQEGYFKFYLPNRILEEEILKYVVIGVEEIDQDNFEDESFELIRSLINLDKTDINFFTFVNIRNGKAIGAFWVERKLFSHFRTAIKTGRFKQNEYGNPINVIPPDEKMLGSLDDIILQTYTNVEAIKEFSKMMFDIWKLSEYRDRLDKKNVIEAEWLQDLEEEYSQIILEQTSKLMPTDSLVEKINDFLNKRKKISKKEVIDILNEKLNSANEVL